MPRLLCLFAALALLTAPVANAQTPSQKAPSSKAPAAPATKAPATKAAAAKAPAAPLPPLPAMKRFPTAQAVVNEHLDAINHCDWTRLMAQYPDDVEFFLPGGEVVKGRKAVGELFQGFVKPVKDGGLCGLKFEPVHTFVVGDIINVSWRGVGEFLKEPYLGADAYETKNGMMQAQVTTFDGKQLKLK